VGSLLDGDFDEKASHLSFAAARDAWKRGSSVPDEVGVLVPFSFFSVVFLLPFYFHSFLSLLLPPPFKPGLSCYELSSRFDWILFETCKHTMRDLPV
jgi:hypothetical protein